MYSEDISSIFSPVLSTKEISILQDKLTEDVCLYQGLFPPPMHLMVFHLLIHLAECIPCAGLPMNFGSMADERGMSVTKSYKSKRRRQC